MEEDNKTISELIDSLNRSIKDIHDHPTHTKDLPTNLEVIVRGVTDSKAIDFIFSDKMDGIIRMLFNAIENGDFDKILSNKEMIKSITDGIFGEGSFQGPISQSVLSNIAVTASSRKYNEMKSFLGKAMTQIKKVNYILKNLKKGEAQYKERPEELKKYKDAVYAIKNVLKFVTRIYTQRRLINRRVFDGLNNIVHEDVLFEASDAEKAQVLDILTSRVNFHGLDDHTIEMWKKGTPESKAIILKNISREEYNALYKILHEEEQ